MDEKAPSLTDKKLEVDIFASEISGNAHAILGRFWKQAKREGWTDEEIEGVQKEAMSGDYDHLLQTLMAHIE